MSKAPVQRKLSASHMEDCHHCIGYQLLGKFHPYAHESSCTASSDTESNEGSAMGQIKVDVNKTPQTNNFNMNIRKASVVEAKMAPLVVVSNRLPFVLKRNEDGELERKPSAGGLVTAVAPVVIQCEGMWVGWPGMYLDDPDTPIPESPEECKAPTAGLKSDQAVAVHVEKQQFDSFYNGCCNGTFWPLFHSMPDRATFDEQNWKSYRQVNNLFALKTMEAIRRLQKKGYPEGETPIIWIHDYHLMLMANTIRMMLDAEDIQCKLGFFLHIPFPPWDIFRLFPWNDEVLQGMLGCDLIGFHIEDYCVNFLDCCQRQLGSRLDRKEMLIEFGKRTVTVRALPIGIPYNRFVQMAKEAPRVVKDDKQKIVLGVDRLDYTKGLVHRIKSFERLLERYPEHLGKVTLLQVAVPSRTDVKEYQMLKEEMDQLVGRINGRFSTPNWSPIRYIYGCISQEELAAFYRDSSVALVTPLRDGMNLVAKEYVACQVDNPGVLILSPFAGAGGMMQEALLANPYELNEVAQYLHRALTMDNDERELRMNGLRKREEANDVDFWLQSFLRAMGTSVRDQNLIPHLNPMSVNDFDETLYHYLDDNCKVTLLLDYDGTLAPIAPKPELALIPPETKRVLERLSNMSDVRVAIISGRTLEDIRQKVGIDGITYAGNQGLEILHPDGIKYVHPIPSTYDVKIKTLLQNLQEKCCTEGAWVENKGILLTYHYRATPKALRPGLVGEARKLVEEAGFKAIDAHCAIEARPPVEWHQGKACIYILRTLYGLEWQDRVRVIYAGDDEPDEEAFSVLKGIAATFRVAPSGKILKTDATMRLSGPDSVLTMLKWVEKHVGARAPRSPSGSPRSGSFSSTGSPRTHSFNNDHDMGCFEMGLHEDAAEMEDKQPMRGRKLSNVLTVDGKKTDFSDRDKNKRISANHKE